MTPPATSRPGWKTILAVTAFMLAALWPLYAYSDLHLRDFPNHMARTFILLHPQDPLLLQNFRIAWAPLPDIGWEMWAMAFGQFLPLVLTAKLMILASFVVGISGCFVLGRLFTGRWSLVPLLSFPFFLNGAYGMGFLSFTLGVSVSLWAMAFWVFMRERNWMVRLAGATMFATLLYLIHFYAFAIYGVFVLGFEIPRLWPYRRSGELVPRLLLLLRDGLQAAPAGLLFLLAQHTEKSAGGIFYHEFWRRLGDVPMLIHSGRPWTDAIPVLLYAGLLLFAKWKGWLSLAPQVRVILALYFLLFLILPDQIIDTAYVAWRTLLPFAFVGIAAMTPTALMPRRALPIFLSIAFLLTLAVPLIRIPDWNTSAEGKRDFLAAIEPLEDGSRLLFAHSGIAPYTLMRDEPGLDHVAAYAVIEKRALVKSMFVLPGQHVLRFRDERLLGPSQGDTNNSETVLSKIAATFENTGNDFPAYVALFDYVVLHGEDPALEARVLPMRMLTLIKREGDFRLYRVTRG